MNFTIELYIAQCSFKMQISEYLTHAESLKLYSLNFVAHSFNKFFKLAR